MKLSLIRAVIVSLSALVAGQTAAKDVLIQQLPDGVQITSEVLLTSAITSKGCTVYEHANGSGESWRINVAWQNAVYDNQIEYSQALSTVGDWWNDRISSVQCDDSATYKCSVSFYRDDNKGGGDIILWGGQGMINLDDWGWNDTVSSLQVFCTQML